MVKDLTSTSTSTTTVTVDQERRLKLMKKFNYNYIREGDFAIVWPNVTIFAVAHVIHMYSIYNLFTDYDDKLSKTWVFSELLIFRPEFNMK